jgi:hypothetical protein
MNQFRCGIGSKNSSAPGVLVWPMGAANNLLFGKKIHSVVLKKQIYFQTNYFWHYFKIFFNKLSKIFGQCIKLDID